MNTPLFSILIANYNNGKYIDVAINSVINQTYKKWEIIIVDDSSTDDSLYIVEKYSKNYKIKIIALDSNKGCGYAKWKCLEEARGTLCGYLDPDDALEDNALEIMVNEHSKNTEVSLIYSRLLVCDHNLVPYGAFRNVNQIPPKKDYLTCKNSAVVHFASFKRNMYLKGTPLNRMLKVAVDQDLYYKLEEQGPLLLIDKYLYYYRQHEAGISTGSNIVKAFRSHITVKEDAFKRRFKNKIYLKERKLNMYNYYFEYMKHFLKFRIKNTDIFWYLVRMKSTMLLKIKI